MALVIATAIDLKAGQVVNGTGYIAINRSGNYPMDNERHANPVFKVVREATQKDWLQSIEDTLGRAANEYERDIATRRGYRYFEIQTD